MLKKTGLQKMKSRHCRRTWRKMKPRKRRQYIMQIYGIYISICCKSLCFGNKHYICIIYGSWALLMSPLKGKLMDCKRMKLDSFPWDSRSVDKTSKCEGKKLDKFFFPKVECTATAVLCC